MSATDARSSGFTLVEILVALAVAMVVLIPLQALFSLGLRAGSLATDSSRALLLAEAGLELHAGRIDLAAGEEAERLDSRFERRSTVQPRPDLLPAGSGQALAYEVSVSVIWQDGRRQRNVTLSTLMLRRAAP